MATTFAIILLNLVVAEIFGITLCGLIFYYVFGYLKNGIGFEGYNANRNLHILLMPIALVFFTGNSLVLYRFFRKTRTLKLKFVHSVIHSICIFASAFGLSTIVDAKDEPIEPLSEVVIGHFDSFATLHSWVGTITLILFLLEYLGGLIMYCMDCVPWEIEDNYAYLHAFFGIWNFILNSLASILGLFTMAGHKHTFTRSKLSCPVTDQPIPYLENSIAVLILLFTGYLLHILLNPYFKWERVILNFI